VGFDPTIERDKIEAGDDLSQAEIKAAMQHLRRMYGNKGKLSGCTSYVQRMMQIGYNHAARILDYLVASGFITEPNNVGIRKPGPSWPDLSE
jgi:DNA segregation ATPase FtsK/SpoIIIE-like protein